MKQHEENLDPINLGDSALATSDDHWFGAYDNVILSGSKYTGDSLLNKEKELLAKFKHQYQSHDHSHNCTIDDEMQGDEWRGVNCEYICGCYEFEEDWNNVDKNGDVIDQFHWVHFHKKEQEHFRHLKKAKRIIQNCKSWKTIVSQLKKIKKLKNLLG